MVVTGPAAGVRREQSTNTKYEAKGDCTAPRTSYMEWTTVVGRYVNTEPESITTPISGTVEPSEAWDVRLKVLLVSDETTETAVSATP